MLAVRFFDGSADMRAVVLSFRQSDAIAVQSTQRATDACTKRVTNVDSKRGSDLRSKQGSFVALS